MGYMGYTAICPYRLRAYMGYTAIWAQALYGLYEPWARPSRAEPRPSQAYIWAIRACTGVYTAYIRLYRPIYGLYRAF